MTQKPSVQHRVLRGQCFISSLCRYKAFEAIFEMDNIEVYKQSDGFTTELEIGKYLRVTH